MIIRINYYYKIFKYKHKQDKHKRNELSKRIKLSKG